MLLNKYPGMEDILASLQNLSSSDEPSHQEQAQHQKLALIAVSEREEKEDLKWGPTLAWIVSKKDLEGKVERDQLKSPATLSHGDGGSFGLLLHKSKGKSVQQDESNRLLCKVLHICIHSFVQDYIVYTIHACQCRLSS